MRNLASWARTSPPRYGTVEPSNGSNVIPRRAHPGLAGLGLSRRSQAALHPAKRLRNQEARPKNHSPSDNRPSSPSPSYIVRESGGGRGGERERETRGETEGERQEVASASTCTRPYTTLGYVQGATTSKEGRCKATWKREVKLAWRKAGLLKSSR